MTEYVKVRPYVAQKLGVLMERYHYPDGNVQLWHNDMKAIDREWVFHKEETVARIGGLLLDPYASKAEQSKSAEECTPLPEATDPAWRGPGTEPAEQEPPVTVEIGAEETGDSEQDDEDSGEGGETWA